MIADGEGFVTYVDNGDLALMCNVPPCSFDHARVSEDNVRDVGYATCWGHVARGQGGSSIPQMPPGGLSRSERFEDAGENMALKRSSKSLEQNRSRGEVWPSASCYAYDPRTLRLSRSVRRNV